MLIKKDIPHQQPKPNTMNTTDKTKCDACKAGYKGKESTGPFSECVALPAPDNCKTAYSTDGSKC